MKKKRHQSSSEINERRRLQNQSVSTLEIVPPTTVSLPDGQQLIINSLSPGERIEVRLWRDNRYEDDLDIALVIVPAVTKKGYPTSSPIWWDVD
jgi:hypothetical protein